MKSFYKGYELRQGVEQFAHKLCKALKRSPVDIQWVSWTSTAGISSCGRLILADIRDDATVSHAVFEKYCGFVAHELCHHTYTDFDQRSNIAYLDTLLNAVEDAWIEHKAIRLNMTGNIEHLFSALVEGMVAEALGSVTDWSNPAQYPFALAVYLRDHAKTKVPLAFGLEPIFAQAKVMLSTSKSSADNLVIARWVFEQLKQNGKGKGKGKEEGQEEGQDGGQEGQGKGKKADKGQDQGQPTGEGDSPSDGDSDGTGEGDGDGEGEGKAEGNGEGEGEGVGKAQPVTDDSDAVEVEPTNSAPEGTGGIGCYSKERSVYDPQYNLSIDANFDVKINVPAKLRYTVKRLFDNSGLEEFQRNRKSGSINVYALPKIGFTDRLFKRRLEVEGIDSAVVILLDLSSSMFTDERDCGRIRNAVKTTYALLETMSRAGVATCVVTFGRGVSVLKPWTMPLPKIADLLSRVREFGCTNDYFAVRYGHELLLARHEERKILFSITDGVGDIDQVREQCLVGERLGITTVGVGIGLDVGRSYPQNVTVLDSSELGTTSFEKIKLVA